eukprot:303980-Chlamydomonas_euryale.AAC.16
MHRTAAGTLESYLVRAQLKLRQPSEKSRGFDARCVSNLVWALVKLEVPTDAGTYGYDVVSSVSPLVVHFLPMSSSQGLANLLWGYSKMNVPVLDVMMMIVAEMTVRLQTKAFTFDAQALSNSIWAMAHVRSHMTDLDSLAGMPGLTINFMSSIAMAASHMLRKMQTSLDATHMQASMLESENRFSCQALVNICWSFASLLGDEVPNFPAVSSLFASIRAEALVRLCITANALQLNQAWILRLPGGFNEQALSNIVYAFDKAQLLDGGLLQSVYTVAALRLQRSVGRPTFKPQELCTLLRAAQSDVAQPWAFLATLQNQLLLSPDIVHEWSMSERSELDRALTLLETYRTAGLMQQLKLDHAMLTAQHAYSLLSHVQS